MAKKEKSVYKKAVEIFTKLKNFFPADVYYVKPDLLFAGDLSSDKLYGDSYIILDTESSLVLQEVIDNPGIVYINDVTKCKEWLKCLDEEAIDNIEVVSRLLQIKPYPNDGEMTDKFNKIKERIESREKNIDEWHSFIECPEKLVYDIFTDNRAVELSLPNCETVTVSKKIFPTVTPKKLNTLFYSIQKEDGEMWSLSVKINGDYFVSKSIYFYIGLK